ncbi:maestro heat-like repeat-containing protein family member 7 [Spheniscus humboldti]
MSWLFPKAGGGRLASQDCPLAQAIKVETVLEGKKKSLLEACFRSVFLLPPKTDMQGPVTALYFGTLDAMDTMLWTLVLSSPSSGFPELQAILQMLLTFANCQSAAVCERAVGRIGRLSDLLASCSSVQVWSTFVGDNDSPACHTEIRIPLLGQLLGRLILCCTCKNREISWGALDALHYLFRFILQQKSASRSIPAIVLLQKLNAHQESRTCSSLLSFPTPLRTAQKPAVSWPHSQSYH